MEKRLALAELEIAKQFKNGTKLNKEKASEILDLMKNNKIEILTIQMQHSYANYAILNPKNCKPAQNLTGSISSKV